VIADNGRGLGARRDDSHGLEIMRERATLVDGDLTVTNNSPHGTVVSVRLNPPGVSEQEPPAEPDSLPA
jgi:nitrate/nitrite-specific signal transduction histidine kinase